MDNSVSRSKNGETIAWNMMLCDSKIKLCDGSNFVLIHHIEWPGLFMVVFPKMITLYHNHKKQVYVQAVCDTLYMYSDYFHVHTGRHQKN